MSRVGEDAQLRPPLTPARRARVVRALALGALCCCTARLASAQAPPPRPAAAPALPAPPAGQAELLRAEIRRAHAAEQQGHPEEALRLLDAAMLRLPGVSWRHLPAISIKKAELLTQLGRLQAARSLLGSVAQGDGVPEAVRVRAAAELERAERVALEQAVLRWVRFAGGVFEMGSAAGDLAAAANERPRHSVSVAAFELLHAEVSVRSYAACVEAGGCTAPDAAAPTCNWGRPGRDDHPVNCVTWDQAAAFCASAGGRLPTEAEWEFAARGGGGERPHPWGAAAPDCQRAVLSEGGAQSAGCGALRTWPVCSKAAGGSAGGDGGVCDLAGNVAEWVADCWHRSYAGAPADSSAWTTSCVGAVRVARGGSLYSPAAELRSTSRSADFPGAGYDYVGFRCARAPQ